ncbi:MAG: patatin-like phospholipase family protein [bacterium]
MKKTKTPKIGLALGSGGFRGACHIGVIKELLKAKIPIDYIAGSSAGALFGGIYAATKDIKTLEEKFLKMKPKEYLYWFSDITLLSGLVEGNKIVEFLRQFVGTKDIQDCKIPFRPVCTNLETGRTVILNKGDLATTIRASGAVPLILTPVKIGKRWLIDGGASQTVPTKTVRDMGADIVIGVNVNSKIENIKKTQKDDRTIFPKISMVNQFIDIMLHHLAKENCSHADIVISPKVSEMTNLKMNEYLGTDKPIKAGQAATKKAIPHIMEKIEKWMKSQE